MHQDITRLIPIETTLMPEEAILSPSKPASPINIIPIGQTTPFIGIDYDDSSTNEDESSNWRKEDTTCQEEGVVKRMKHQLRRILRPLSSSEDSVLKNDHQASSSRTHNFPASTHNVYIDGRRYQNYNNCYFFPNDEIEMDRLLNNHFLVKQCFGSNYSAPVNELLSIEKPQSPSFHEGRLNSPPSAVGTGIPSNVLRPNTANSAQSTSPGKSPTSEHADSSVASYANSLHYKRGNPSISDYFRKLTSLKNKPRERSPTATPTMARSASPTIPFSPTTTTPLGVPTSTPPDTLSPFTANNATKGGVPNRRSHHSEGDIRHLQQNNSNKFDGSDLALNVIYQNINTTRVLDVACGIGIWILEMAHEFPHAEFYGFDLSEIFPTAIRPSNTFFCLCDMNLGFPYPAGFFDFIHMQDVFACFPATSTEFIMQEIQRCLKPGGYVELKEIDFVIFDPGPVTAKFTAIDSMTASGLMEQHGVDIKWPRLIRKQLNSIKMADVHSQMIPLTYSHRPSEDEPIDKMCYRYWNDRLDACRRLFLEIHGGEELDKEVEGIKKEMLDRSSYCCYYMAWGRKPLVDDDCYYNKLTNSNRSNSFNAYDRNKDQNLDISPTAAIEDTMNSPSGSFGYDIYDFTDGFTD